MGLFDFLNQPGILTGINQGIQQLRLEDNNKFEKYLDKAINYVETQALPLINESKKILASEVRVARRLAEMEVDDNVIKAIASTGRGALGEFYTSVMTTNAKMGATQKQITGEDINQAVKGAELFKDDNQTILDFMTKTYLPNVGAGMDKASAFDISGVRGRAYKELDDYAGTVLADGTSLTYKDLYTLIKGGSYTGFNYSGDDMAGVNIDQTILKKPFAKPLAERLQDEYGNAITNSFTSVTNPTMAELQITTDPFGLLLAQYTQNKFGDDLARSDEYLNMIYSNATTAGSAYIQDVNKNLFKEFNNLLVQSQNKPFINEQIAKAWITVFGKYTRDTEQKIYYLDPNGVVVEKKLKEF